MINLNKDNIIVIVGPTASGKTSLAIKIAKEVGGEVISADSRCLYKDMNIGTAKPSKDEMQGIPHWGIDLISPSESFNAAEFKRYAEEKIHEIKERHHIPIIAGGTGLYVDAIVFNYQFCSNNSGGSSREELEKLSIEDLYAICEKKDIKLPNNKKNKRYVVSQILRNGETGTRQKKPINGCLLFGIYNDKELLRQRIDERARKMVDNGLIEETIDLSKKYGWDIEPMKSNAYPLVKKYLDKEIDLNKLMALMSFKDWHLAKRQLTWFKRDQYINWMTSNKIIEMINS